MPDDTSSSSVNLEDFRRFRPRGRINGMDIHRQIAGREAVVLQALGIYPQRTSHQHCPFPDHEDKNLSWRWDGGKRRWLCSCGHGSVVDAVMRMQGVEAGEAIRWVRQLLDGDAPPAARVRPAKPAERPPEKPNDEAAAYVRKIWARAIPIAGTIAERYLREHRGIAGPLPEQLRMVWNLRHKEADRYFPALLIPAFDEAGALRRVQAVYLDLATGGKAPVPNPKRHGKKTFGKEAAEFPAIFPGRKPGRRFDVVLTEGPEDAVALWSALDGEATVAASLSAGILHRPRFASGTRLLIVGDGDAAGRKAALTAATAHASRGCEAWTAYPPDGIKDSNQLLIEHGPDTVLAMLDTAEPFIRKAEAPAGLSAAEAAERSRQAVARFFERMMAWRPEAPSDPLNFNPGEPPPVMGVRGSTGLGKTQNVLEWLIRPELADKYINFFAPLVRLNGELVERFNVMAGPDAPRARVVYGRDQVRPDGVWMCAKADIARDVGRLGQNVQATVCARKRDDGEIEKCEFFDDCAYQKQRADKAPGVRFYSHAHLFIRDAVARADANIVDESFYQAGLRGQDGRVYLLLEDLRLPRRDLGAGTNADIVGLGERCVRALRAGGRLADFQAEGIAADEARWARGIEYGRVERLNVSPAMPRKRQEEAIQRYKQQEALKFGRFFTLLAKCLEADIDPHCFHIREQVPNGDGRPEDRLLMAWSEDIRVPAAPTLLLDADLDAAIAARFFPALEEPIDAEARPAAYNATQIMDQRVTMQMLCVSHEVCKAIRETGAIPAELGEKDRTRVRNVKRLRQLAEAKTAGGRRGLVVSYKAAVEALRVLPAIPNVEFAHYGALRGCDRWKDFDFVIVAGAPEVNVEDIELMAKAVWHMAPEALATMPPDSHGRRRYGKEPDAIELAAGGFCPVSVSTHPDARCRTLIRQLHREVDQAIGRLRLIHRPAERPVEVLILTNVPTSLPVHQLSTWREILPGPVAVMMARGIVPQRLRDIAKVLPELVESGQADPRSAVSKALAAAGVDPNEPFTFPYKESFIGKSERFALARYRLAGERKSATAWVDLHRHPDPRAALEAVFGELALFESLEEPAPAGESESAAAAPVADAGEVSDLVAVEALQPAPPELEPSPEPAMSGGEDPDVDPWHGWPGPDPAKMPRVVVDNPPPELSDAELISLLPPKRMSATAVDWEIKAHDVLRARRVEWVRAQRLVRAHSAAHDWMQHARAAVAPSLAPAWAQRAHGIPINSNEGDAEGC